MALERFLFAAAFSLAQRGAADIPHTAVPLIEDNGNPTLMENYQTEPVQDDLEQLDPYLCAGGLIVGVGLGLIGYQAMKAGRRTTDPMSNSDPDKITLFNGQPMKKTEKGYVPDERTDN